MRWAVAVLTLEVRKFLAYRAEFWLGFVGNVLAQFAIAYFLWRAIYESRGASEMAGFSFPELMLYYILAPLVSRVVSGSEMGFLSQDIYEGSLSRYLLYPIPLFGFKYASHLATSCIALLQFFPALFLALLLLPPEAAPRLSAASVALGLFAAFLATFLFFALAALIELIAFWADNVWSLAVLLRMAWSLLGGAMVPLEFFPAWAQAVLRFSPFPYMLHFPVRTLTGHIAGADFLRGCVLTVLWGLFFLGLCRFLWHRGLRHYAGVGI